MRIAVISDIHGNFEAFKEVLADIDRSSINEIICLGDMIGYGPEPEEVVSLARSRHIPSVMGNHEWGLTDKLLLSWFNPFARRALLITESLISDNTFHYVTTLPTNLTLNTCLFVHGCPPEDITTYLFELSQHDLKTLFLTVKHDICFVGHTHQLELISFSKGHLRASPIGEGKTKLKKGNKYIINAGSVGQPRDGNNKAKYVIWDDKTHILEARFIPYDYEKTAEKIISRGIPKTFAQRLF